jgi:HEAT repeat protein
LANTESDRAINVLAQALRDDAEAEVRLGAIRALGRVGGKWARRDLRRAARDWDPAISLAAEEALTASPSRD